jgi:hypothetical protein
VRVRDRAYVPDWLSLIVRAKRNLLFLDAQKNMQLRQVIRSPKLRGCFLTTNPFFADEECSTAEVHAFHVLERTRRVTHTADIRCACKHAGLLPQSAVFGVSLATIHTLGQTERAKLAAAAQGAFQPLHALFLARHCYCVCFVACCVVTPSTTLVFYGRVAKNALCKEKL